MKILSLFDGMSCGRIALERAGFKVGKYYASEIDKWATLVTRKNYPNTIHLGDITAWKDWKIEQPDIIIGGSPCQGFSIAGKQLNFNDPRSKLFFTFVDILKHYKPKYFLLENVVMKREYLDVISEALGVEPIKINSALVSAQNRKRLYWTNIPGIEQPEDLGIVLKDVLEHSPVGDKYRISSDSKFIPKDITTSVIDPYNKKCVSPDKSTTLRLNHSNGNCWVADTQMQKGCIQIGEADLKGHDSIKRVYSEDGKSPALTTMGGGHREPKVAIDKLQWRKLTPIECERLQTVPDKYTLVPWKNRMMSNSQRYKMLGNGWTVDVIAHIFSYMKEEL